jgi:hypothetical protein
MASQIIAMPNVRPGLSGRPEDHVPGKPTKLGRSSFKRDYLVLYDVWLFLFEKESEATENDGIGEFVQPFA